MMPTGIMPNFYQTIIVLIISSLFTVSCSSVYETIVYQESPQDDSSLNIHEGLLSQRAQRIKYKKDGRTVAVIKITKPILVAQATQEEQWGFFQFPKLGVSDDGVLVVSWQMKEDSPSAYGKASSRECVPMISKDGGVSWRPQDRSYSRYIKEYNTRIGENGLLQITTPQTRTINSFRRFPRVAAQRGQRFFYKIDELPEELQGAYLYYRSSGKTTNIHAKLNDPGLLRYSVDGMVPVQWWGDIKVFPDNSLVAGVYPCYYLDANGSVMPSGVTFYQSFDRGYSWSIIGKVPSLPWRVVDSLKGDGGLVEPTFEVLPNGSFICVMRTGSSTPMYKSFSFDKGKTWTYPVAFTPNGVKPQLMLLNNGILALVSGRPGIQLRFSLDGTGNEWTEPIDMIPFMNEDGSYRRDVSCGYASILEAGDDSLYLVYSDFTTKNRQGVVRKSIWFRKITVTR